MAGDGRIVIDVILDDGSVVKGVTDLDGKIGKLGGSGEKASFGIGKIVTALGLVALAKGAIDLVKGSIDKAFGRIDTMEQFERVMTTMTGSTEKANDVLAKTNEVVKGTAYGLDVGARAVQNFVTSNMDVDKATGTLAAWGDAVAFYGDGSNDTFASVSDAIAKMVAKGKVQMDTMNRFTEAGIPAMQIYADATGQSVESVAEQMSKGELDATKFLDVMNDALVNGTASFAGIEGAAKEAGASWGGSFDNMGAAVARGVTNVIQSIDEMLTSNGLPDMREMVAMFGKKFEEILTMVAEAIPPLVDKIKEVYTNLEPWMPLITALATGIGVVVAAFLTFNSIKMIIDTIRNSQLLLNAAVLLNPWVLAAAAAIAAVMLIIHYWEPIKAFFIDLWASVKESSLAIWDSLKESWQFAVDGLKESWVDVAAFFSGLWDGIKNVFMTAYDFIDGLTSGAFTAYFNIVLAQMTLIWNNIQAIWDYVKNTFINAFDFLKALVTGDFEGMKNAIKSQMDNILNLITTIWNNVKTFFMSVLSAILDVVKQRWEDIKSITSTVFEAVKSFISNVWNSIKSFFSSILSNILNDVKSKFENMKSAITEKVNAAKAVINSVWNSIKSFLLNTLISIVTTVIGKFTEVVTNVRTKSAEVVTTVKTKFQEVFNAIKTKLVEAVTEVATQIGKMPGKVREKISEMKTVGKDLIMGLINGIKDMAGDAIDAITGVVGGVITAAKNLLKSKSPSRVFIQIGKDIDEGMAIGITDNSDIVEEAITDMGLLIIDIADHYKQEEKKITKKSNDEIAIIEKRSKEDVEKINRNALVKKRKTTVDENTKIQRIQENAIKKIAEIEKKAISDSIKLLDAAQKDKLKEIKLFIDEKKSLDQLSLADESSLWKKATTIFAEGTKERIEAQKNYNTAMKNAEKQRISELENYVKDKKKSGEMSLSDEIRFWNAMYGASEYGSEQYETTMNNHQKAVAEIRKETEAVNKEYTDKILAVEKEFNAESNKLHEEWIKAYDDQFKKLMSFSGLFDEFKRNLEVTGRGLITNLNTQVNALKDYGDVINSLDKRIQDEGLIKELKSMGVKSLGELQALNRLSDSELALYAELYKEKFRLAKENTDNEMQPMMEDIDEKLIQLQKDSEKRLDELNKEWQNKIRAIVHGTAKEFDSMKQVGIDAMTGLRNGMDAMSGSLMAKAQSIANAIKATIQAAFDINSPSRWMKDMIGRNMMLGWMLGIDREKSATLKKAKEAADWMKPDVPKVGGFVNKLRGVTAPIGNVMPFSAAQNGGNSVSNSSSKTFAPQFINHFTPAESTPSENTRKQKRLAQELYMQY